MTKCYACGHFFANEDCDWWLCIDCHEYIEDMVEERGASEWVLELLEPCGAWEDRFEEVE